MGKSSGGKAEVTEYKMSIHIGVALELDSVRRILVDEKVAWHGNLTSNATLQIDKPDLFGGTRKEGGLVGAIEVLMGRSTQVLPVQVANRYGLAPTDCPAFRGLTTLMFRGSNQVGTGYLNNWEYYDLDWEGDTGTGGFTWKHNSAVIAQKVEVEGTCAPKTTLNQAYAMIDNPDQPLMPDANPAHIIYEALIDDEFGMGSSADLIDTDAFEAAAETLYNEGFGLSILWMRQSTIQKIVNEVLDHIQATIFSDPTTGLLSIKLHRDDYDVEDLFVISPDNAKLTAYRVRSGGEIINEVSVSWTNPINEKTETITAQDIASIQAQGGEKVSTSRDYYGVRHAGLARKLLARDLRESTAPLISCEAEIDRSAWNLTPGSVVVLNWPRRNLYGIVMRVGKVNYGKPGATTVRVPLVQDIFSLSRPPIAIDPGTGWQDPAVDPQPLTMQLTTLPAYFSRNGQVQTNLVELVEPEVLAMSLADSQDEDSLDYELVTETTGPGGDPLVLSQGAMTMTPLALLEDALVAEAVSEIPAALYPNLTWSPSRSGFVLLGTDDENQEIAFVSGITDTGWTIERGCLDTIPRSWPADTPVWAINPGAKIVDIKTIHSAGETVTYRGLDRTSRGLLAYDDAPDVTATLTERPHLPLRPANVKVGATAFGTHAIGIATTFTVTWANRNRAMEDTQVLLWTDGSVTPEYRQEAIIRVYNVAGGALVAEYAHLWTETSKVFQKTDFDRYASIRVEVLSRIDDRESLQAHSITISGFANNPSAPLPPTGPDREPPPSTLAAPGPGAFTAGSGTEYPSLVVAGLQDNPDATALIAQYRPAGTAEWIRHAPVALDQEAIRFDIPGLLPSTVYEIGVAYQIDGLVGQFRRLSDETTRSRGFGAVDPADPVVTDLVEELFDNAAAQADAFLIEEARRRAGDADQQTRLDVIGEVNPIDGTVAVAVDRVTVGGTAIGDVRDRVVTGLDESGAVAQPIPQPVLRDSGGLNSDISFSLTEDGRLLLRDEAQNLDMGEVPTAEFGGAAAADALQEALFAGEVPVRAVPGGAFLHEVNEVAQAALPEADAGALAFKNQADTADIVTNATQRAGGSSSAFVTYHTNLHLFGSQPQGLATAIVPTTGKPINVRAGFGIWARHGDDDWVLTVEVVRTHTPAVGDTVATTIYSNTVKCFPIAGDGRIVAVPPVDIEDTTSPAGGTNAYVLRISSDRTSAFAEFEVNSKYCRAQEFKDNA